MWKTPHAEETVALFERHRSGLLRYLLAFGLTIQDGEEIVQEVFLALFGHLRRGKSRVNLDGWVFRVAHNLALKRRVRVKREISADVEERADAAPDPEAQWAASQRQHRLLAVVRAMPETDRLCLALRAEGLRYREIADVLGISLGSVANAMERSLARLARAEELGKSFAER
jgi:RNA polymerase sigma-70 factor (ECF subfamily)